MFMRQDKVLRSTNYETRWNPLVCSSMSRVLKAKRTRQLFTTEYDTRNIDASFSMCMKRQLETSSLMKRKETKEEGLNNE